MENAVIDSDGRREVERAGQLRGQAERVGGPHRSVLSDRDVERLGDDVVLRKIRGHAVYPGRDRCHNRRMRQRGRNQPFEFSDQLVNALGREVELKQLDGD